MWTVLTYGDVDLASRPLSLCLRYVTLMDTFVCKAFPILRGYLMSPRGPACHGKIFRHFQGYLVPYIISEISFSDGQIHPNSMTVLVYFWYTHIKSRVEVTPEVELFQYI